MALLQPGDVLLSRPASGAPQPRATRWSTSPAAQAGQAAGEGGASRLLLTHILDENLTGTAADTPALFDGPVELARPGRQVEIG